MPVTMPTATQFIKAKEEFERGLEAVDQAKRQVRAACVRLISLHENQAIATDCPRHKAYAESMAAHYSVQLQKHGG